MGREERELCWAPWERERREPSRGKGDLTASCRKRGPEEEPRPWGRTEQSKQRRDINGSRARRSSKEMDDRRWGRENSMDGRNSGWEEQAGRTS
jgi:hypothetical protein